MTFGWEESLGAFAAASKRFVTLTAAVGTRWDQPGLGEWDVRALVGHTSRALLTVEAYLGRPARSVTQISTRVLDLVRRRDGSELLTTIVGGMRLSDYLPTRTFELSVHGADLAAALGEPLDLPPSAAHQALRIVEELAVLDGLAAPLLLAATGRHGLASGFTVL